MRTYASSLTSVDFLYNKGVTLSLYFLMIRYCYNYGYVFHHWVESILMPDLPSKSVIVIMPLFTKRQNTQNLIQNAGRTILYLPPYSPNFNEHTWA